MHHSKSLVIVTLLLACYSSQASLAQSTCDVFLKKENASTGGKGSMDEDQNMRGQDIFNRIDKDGNGVLTRMELAAQKTSDPDYKREDVDALNAQVIKLDQNMDGYLQASEYGKLMADGTVYGLPPNFSEVARNGRIDYCQLTTSLELHHNRRQFAGHDTNNDNTISFKEYVAYAELTSAIKRQRGATDDAKCLEHEINKRSLSAK